MNSIGRIDSFTNFNPNKRSPDKFSILYHTHARFDMVFFVIEFFDVIHLSKLNLSSFLFILE